jgi:acetyl coenzyme A synthetase (ADP forming)-like protein
VTDLSGLFDADRVALVGATDREESIGLALMRNLVEFDGDLIPINPNRDAVLGHECHPAIGEAPEATSIDLAVVAVPARAVIDVVRQAGEVGVSNAVVISAGFGERGTEGERRERELREIADHHDINLVGPNCIGVVSTPNGLNATFLESSPHEGSVSLMSQSGAFVSAAISWATQRDIGFNNVVSLGNEAVLDEVDFVAEWGGDPDTDVILAYLEDIDDGRAFVETAREVTAHTPVVVLKSGRTEAGAEAAASHTGSIAGSDQAYRAGFRKAGVLRATSIQEAFDTTRVLDGQPLFERDDVAVVTNGGGPGVLTTDAIGESRLSIAEFDDDVRAELGTLLPAAADVSNPLDIVGDADLDRYRAALEVVLGADTVGGVVVLAVPTALFEFDDLAELVGDLQRQHAKPVVACLMGGEAANRATDALATRGIPSYSDPTRAVSSLEALAEYEAVTDRDDGSPAAFDVDRERARETVTPPLDRGTDYLGVEAIELLDAYGIPTPSGEVVEAPSDAETVAAELGGPVVLKIVSPDITHKSDVGGVEVGVPVEDVRDTCQRLLERATSHDPEATILGVRVEELVDPDAGTETIVGVKRDPQFGHLLLFGLGGIFVQVFRDTSFRVVPVSEQEAREMTREIQAAPMLRGARGREPADVDSVVETLGRVSQLVTQFSAIAELDINPLVVGPDGVRAVDLRLTVDRQELATRR